MKIRAGFVTNSSSTSYTIVIDTEYLNEVLAKLHPYVKAVVNALRDDQKFMGKKVSILSYVSGNYDTLEYLDIKYKGDPDEEVDEDEWDDGRLSAYQAMNKFEEALSDKEKYVLTSQECG
jgi:hypothetical protein